MGGNRGRAFSISARKSASVPRIRVAAAQFCNSLRTICMLPVGPMQVQPVWPLGLRNPFSKFVSGPVTSQRCDGSSIM